MKFMDTIHRKNYISLNGLWDAIIEQLYPHVMFKQSLSVKKHPRGNDDTNNRLVICQ
jgi:hypothetical protein